MNGPALVVLAAGIGSRYGGFKQIEPIGPEGEIGLDYSLYDAWRAGFRNVVFVIRPEIEAPFREHFGDSLAGRLETEYVFQSLDDLPEGSTVPEGRSKPWGTAHAVWAARNALDGPFGVINADDYYGVDSYRVLADFLKEQGRARTPPPTYAMVGFVLRNTLSEHGTVSRGICSVDAHGYLETVVERTRIRPAGSRGAEFRDEDGQWHALSGDERTSMNMWGFTADILMRLGDAFEEFLEASGHDTRAEFFLPRVVDDLIGRGLCRTRVLETDAVWAGITYPEDRPAMVRRIAEQIRNGVYPSPLWDNADAGGKGAS